MKRGIKGGEFGYEIWKRKSAVMNGNGYGSPETGPIGARVYYYYYYY